MRIAYLDCFAGISGDMFLGALLDAGVPPPVLHDAVTALNLDATLQIETVDRSGISATKVNVLENGHLAEDGPDTRSHTHPAGTHTHPDSATHTHDLLPHQQTAATHSHQLETQHLHKTGQPHTHELEPELTQGQRHTHPDEEVESDQPQLQTQAHAHSHSHSEARSLTTIRDLIQASALAPEVKQLAIEVFTTLGHSEARIHNVPVDAIHFHEVGAVDAIVDIVASSAGIHYLNSEAIASTGSPIHWHSSPLNVGGGMVDCAHGRFPVPAPATADLLRGIPTYSANIEKELVTPTGAALIRTLAPAFGPQPPMRVSQIGYGAGSRNPANFPNVLRLSIGESAEPATPPAFPGSGANSTQTTHPQRHNAENSVPSPEGPAEELNSRHNVPQDAAAFEPSRHHVSQHVTVLETALDDISPQILAHVAELALRRGALDVMLTPTLMKKGRPGTLITILANPADAPALERLLLSETSTLGIRIRTDRRLCLDRTHTTVETLYGPIRIKLGTLEGQVLNAAPEFEDCRAAATTHNVPVKQVQQAATAAYVASQTAGQAE